MIYMGYMLYTWYTYRLQTGSGLSTELSTGLSTGLSTYPSLDGEKLWVGDLSHRRVSDFWVRRCFWLGWSGIMRRAERTQRADARRTTDQTNLTSRHTAGGDGGGNNPPSVEMGDWRGNQKSPSPPNPVWRRFCEVFCMGRYVPPSHPVMPHGIVSKPDWRAFWMRSLGWDVQPGWGEGWRAWRVRCA